MNQVILIDLFKNKNVYNQIVRDYPGLYTACLTIQQNISKDAVEKAKEKLINFYNNNEKFKLFIDSQLTTQPHAVTQTNDVAGLIIILDKKEESYKKLLETAKKENWNYKGIAIVDQFDSIRLYFY